MHDFSDVQPFANVVESGGKPKLASIEENPLSMSPFGGAAHAQPAMPALRVGVVFISHQAPGCHNVVSGVFDYLQSLEPKGELVGILGGWKGLMNQWIRPITRETVDMYKNLGGQELLCHFGDSPS